MIVGITGAVGSGKTTIAKIFSRHHFNRIDADEIGHEIIKKNSAAYKKIIEEFGNGILGKNKNIDRKKLGNVVFNNANKLKKLNSITHPIIINEIKHQIKIIKEKCGNKTRIIVDAPLLLETKIADKVIVVRCSKENTIKRNKKYPREKIERILKLQMPLGEKIKHADFVIDNNKGMEHLEKLVIKVIKSVENKK
ncbi:dephospho-CoA kinase [Candidatus Woesearchaeota archaeon]|nr:dephospho-CoA kinase [Candidatus Woesearchaeota archaeon]